jgi:hypothetical protein
MPGPTPSLSLERTRTRSYPREETKTMREFYGSETCVVCGFVIAYWAHMLDPIFEASNERVSISQGTITSADDAANNLAPMDVRPAFTSG